MRTGNPAGIKPLGTHRKVFFPPEDVAGDCWQQLCEES